jgi:nucleotide-binding universal stress UspA family protein
MPGIIVGVDGSDHSRSALHRAMHVAVLRQVPLTAMTVRPAIINFWGLRALPRAALTRSRRAGQCSNSWTKPRAKPARRYLGSR